MIEPVSAELLQPSGDLTVRYALILSNLALVPAMIALANRGDLAGGVIFLSTFIASVLYHSCRAEFFCVMDPLMHVTTDYLFVYRAIVYSVVVLPFRPLKSLPDALVVFTLYSLLVDPVYFTVLARAPFATLPIFGIAVPFAVTFAYTLVEAKYREGGKRRRFFARRGWALIGAVLAVVAGAFMFALPESWYGTAHTMWHICSMSAAYCMTRARAF